jgi:hypothetical protein
MRQWKIHRPHGHTVLLRPREGLPLRAERSERQERGPLRLIGHVPEERDGGLELLVPHPVERPLAIGGQLHQHHRRLKGLQGAYHRPGRARAVMANAQQPHLAHSARHAS